MGRITMTLTRRIERISKGETKVKIWRMTSSGAAERDAEGKNSVVDRVIGIMDARNCTGDGEGGFGVEASGGRG